MSRLLQRIFSQRFREEENGEGNNGAASAPVNYLDMSDDDILNMSAPTPVAATIAPEAPVVVAEPAKEPDEKEENLPEKEEDPEKSTETPSNDGEDGSNIPPEQVSSDKAPAADKATSVVDEPVSTDPKKPEGESEAASTAAVPVDYKASYEKIMAPFRANGKTITLQSPEEAIQLMQMGANYTRKMQDIQPHRKMLMMLENNGLLDEGKLSYLIDLDKKNPEAIKKLIKDAGIEPMDIDTSTEPAYLEGNHRVDDADVNFRTVLDDLTSHPTGQETVNTIHSTWDQASKEELWKDPSLMTAIHTQRENGIYAAITTELDRQKTLGLLPAGLPFLAAYKKVGDQLAAQATKGNPTTNTPAVVVTRAAAPKPTVTNGDRVSAATSTRSAPRKAATLVNPLEMSDEDFLKLPKLNGR